MLSVSTKTITAVAALVLALSCAVLYTGYAINRQNFRRSLQADTTEAIGTVKVDFYNTYTRGWLGGKSFAMSRSTINSQMRQLNGWYEGKVIFELGDVYEYDNPDMYIVRRRRDGPCIEIRNFADSSAAKRRDRISVVLSRNINSEIMISCVSEFDHTLGNRRAAAMILRTDFKSWFGGGIAHGMGRLFGFGYTSDDYLEGVRDYNQCGKYFRYPFYRIDDLFDNMVVANGERYPYNAWQGRQNLMARFRVETLLWGVLTSSLGVFINNYGPVFSGIVDCWFDRTNRRLAQLRNGTFDFDFNETITVNETLSLNETIASNETSF